MLPPTSEEAMSMHAGVETWDCLCSQKPAAHWAEVASELAEANDEPVQGSGSASSGSDPTPAAS